MTPPARRLLMINYYFPPTQTVAGVRLANFCREARHYFDYVHALASANRRFFPQDPSLEISGQQVSEITAYDLRWLRQQLRRRPLPHLSASARQRPLVQFLQKLSQSLPLNLLFGDGGPYYLYRGYREGCRLVRQHHITHLFSSYRPYADHLIAYWLKRRFPHLVWMADFRDLQVDPVLQHSFWPAFQWWCNRQVLKQAEVVSTVSEGLKTTLGAHHPNVLVLPNGIGKYERTEQPRFPQFTIAYTGSLYPGAQSAAPLFSTLQQLISDGQLSPKDLRLRYAGKDSAIWEDWVSQYGLQHLSKATGLRPLQGARSLQQRAHINLLLSWSAAGSRGILTGKLYEYLAAGRPILCLLKAEAADPEWQNLFAPLKNSLLHTSSSPPEAIQAFILNHYLAWKSGERLGETFDKEPFTWAVQMEGFVGALREMGWY